MSVRYDSVAKSLHWLIALAIIGMLALGWIMTDMSKDDPNRFTCFQLHKSIGITILLLSLIRLGWRLTHKAPPLPAHMAAWEKFAARATHFLFYVLIIGMPMTGWVIVSTSPIAISTLLYGVVPWPHLPILPTLGNKREIGHAFGEIHGIVAYVIAGTLVLHVGAALKHHFINRNDVLTRMAPAFLTGFLNRIGGPRALGLIGLLVPLLAFSAPAFANSWVVDYTHSHLGFTGSQGGTPFEGAFKNFQATIDFDPMHLEISKISATIDIASITAGDPERDGYLPQSDWFDTKKFPQAQFTSDTIRPGADGHNCFEAIGTLSIKAILQPVTLPFCLTHEGDHMRAQGHTTLIRTNFNVGTGQWANDALVKHEVDVTIDIAAKQGP